MKKGTSTIVYEQQNRINRENISKVKRSVGLWINEQRKEMNLSETELAEMLDVQFEDVNKIELGKWISFEMLIKISIIFKNSAFNKKIASKIIKDRDLFFPTINKFTSFQITNKKDKTDDI